MSCRDPILVCVILMGSLLVSTALGFEHEAAVWEVQEANEAEDAIYRDDAQECLDASEGVPGVHCTALYPQVTDPWTVHPLTIQRPPDCLGQDEDPLQPPGFEPSWGLSRHSFFYMAGFMHYSDSDCQEDASPLPSGWLNEDITLDPEVPVIGYWHLSAHETEPSMAVPDLTQDQEAIQTPPCVTLRMVLETGRDRGAGTVIAQGQTTKTLVTDHVQAVMPEPCPDAHGEAHFDNVTAFRVEMDKPQKPIPQFDGFVLHVQWFYHERGSSDDPLDEDQFTPREWSLHTDHEHVNRIVLPAKQSLAIAPPEVQTDDEHLRVTTEIRSMFGVHDLDPEHVRLEILDEQGMPVEADGVGRLHYQVSPTSKSINVSASWEVVKQDLAPGNYTARVTAENWQHTYAVQKEEPFTFGPDLEILLPEDNQTAAVQGVGPAFDPMPLFVMSLVGFITAAVVSIGVSRRLKP